MSKLSTFEKLEKLYELYETKDTLNIFQHSVQALVNIDAHLRQGGYIQLFQNGLGEYCFENPWIESFNYMGLKGIAQNLSAAKEIYVEKKADLEKEASLQEFTAMYNDYPELDILHQAYLSCIEEEMQKLIAYIDAHSEHFNAT